MRTLMLGVSVLGLWLSTTLPASAAWDNVFQPTLFGRCRQRPTTANYTPVIVQSSPVVATPVCSTCNSAPAPVVASASPAAGCGSCSTSYTQRCYYQPVTTYQSQSYYEPVTTYRTSYYYEPVTSYRYSCYYDPCSCSYQQVATPCTSYTLRAQSCPVQSYVQRCAQVPVTAYQKVCYWQPQTTCCTTTEGAPIYAPTSAPVAAPPVMAQPPAVTAAPVPAPVPAQPPQVQTAPSITPAPNPPSISESRTPANGTSQPNNSMYDRYYPRPMPLNTPAAPANPNATTMPPASWQPSNAAPARPVPPPPPVKLDRIVVGPDAHVHGQVVKSDNSPRSNARVLFVDAALGGRQTATTNNWGHFDIDLPAGNWLVYLYGPDDIARYHSRLDVNATQTARLTLVNR
jgi:hypothetical protein